MSNVTTLRRPTVEHRYLSPDQVCELLPGMTAANLQELRKKGLGPKYHKPTGSAARSCSTPRRMSAPGWSRP